MRKAEPASSVLGLSGEQLRIHTCPIWHRVDQVRKSAVFYTSATWDDPVFLLLIGVFLYGCVAAIPIKESSLNLLPVLPFVLFVLLANVAFWRPPNPATAHQIGYVVPPGAPVIPAIPPYWETVVFTIQAAEAMAAAMVSRGFGYDIDHRTELEPTTFKRLDWVMSSIFVAFLIGGFLLDFLEIIHYTFTLRLLGLS